MNEPTLHDLNQSIHDAVGLHRDNFHLVEINTSDGDQISDLERMSLTILDSLEQFLETVLVVPKASVGYLPAAGYVSDRSTIAQFLNDVEMHGRFVERADAEYALLAHILRRVVDERFPEIESHGAEHVSTRTEGGASRGRPARLRAPRPSCSSGRRH